MATEIVVNKIRFGLCLSYEELRRYCDRLNLTLRRGNGETRPNSSQTWFVGMDWLAFRLHPMLVKDVRDGALPDNADRELEVVCMSEGTPWKFDTDWETYERIVQQDTLDGEWGSTTAQWDGEDWRFECVPLDECPRGRTCFSPLELGYSGYDPERAIRCLRDYYRTAKERNAGYVYVQGGEVPEDGRSFIEK